MWGESVSFQDSLAFKSSWSKDLPLIHKHLPQGILNHSWRPPKSPGQGPGASLIFRVSGKGASNYALQLQNFPGCRARSLTLHWGEIPLSCMGGDGRLQAVSRGKGC